MLKLKFGVGLALLCSTSEASTSIYHIVHIELRCAQLIHAISHLLTHLSQELVGCHRVVHQALVITLLQVVITLLVLE